MSRELINKIAEVTSGEPNRFTTLGEVKEIIRALNKRASDHAIMHLENAYKLGQLDERELEKNQFYIGQQNITQLILDMLEKVNHI